MQHSTKYTGLAWQRPMLASTGAQFAGTRLRLLTVTHCRRKGTHSILRDSPYSGS